MMLAEAANNSEVVTWGIILTLTTIASNVALVIGTRRAQKREVSFEFNAASKDEFDKAQASNTRIHDLLFKEIKDTSKDCGDKISTVGHDVAGLKAETKMQNQTLAQISSKLDRIAERQ